jgi:hypothetical protein
MEGGVAVRDPIDYGLEHGLELVKFFGLEPPEPDGREEFRSRIVLTLEKVDAHPGAAALFAENILLSDVARRRAGEAPLDEDERRHYAEGLAELWLCIFHP